ncbi:DUF7919 family protein [Dactylosporangium cerinum]
MTYFADLTHAYSLFDHDTVRYEWGTLDYRPRYERLSVGWLDGSQPFDTGPVPDGFADALLDIVGNPAVNETRGLHGCEFCPSDTSLIADPRSDGESWLAFREIRVPARPGVMFAAPALIWHYVSAHAYRPPAEFVEAVQRYDAGWATEPSPWIPPDGERAVWGRTARNVMLRCVRCGQKFELHYTPDEPGRRALSLATQQLREQCPDHGKEWEFWDKIR